MHFLHEGDYSVQKEVEFPSRWDLNATIVESEIERELPDTYQTNAKKMPYNVYEITNAKYEMLNKLSNTRPIR